MTWEQRLEVAEECDIILATSKIMTDGLCIPRLDTLVLATPHSEIYPIVEHILRRHADKSEPLVIDIINETIPPKYKKHGAVCVYDYPRQWDSIEDVCKTEK